jgi:hypothetical protein
MGVPTDGQWTPPSAWREPPTAAHHTSLRGALVGHNPRCGGVWPITRHLASPAAAATWASGHVLWRLGMPDRMRAIREARRLVVHGAMTVV